MCDYQEEQDNEIEALESIYPDEIITVSETPRCFQISIQTQATKNVTLGEEPLQGGCVLQFTYTASYPDELPLVEILEPDNLEDEHVEKLYAVIKEQGELNIGMVMIYTLVSEAQECLENMIEELASQEQDKKLKLVQAEEEQEQKKFEGTRCTIENFMAWKAKFDAELAEIAGRNKSKQTNKKLTGKELFSRDHTLDASDAQYYEEEGEAVDVEVEVDESLFQDLDDLDIDLEDDDS